MGCDSQFDRHIGLPPEEKYFTASYSYEDGLRNNSRNPYPVEGIFHGTKDAVTKFLNEGWAFQHSDVKVRFTLTPIEVVKVTDSFIAEQRELRLRQRELDIKHREVTNQLVKVQDKYSK